SPAITILKNSHPPCAGNPSASGAGQRRFRCSGARPFGNGSEISGLHTEFCNRLHLSCKKGVRLTLPRPGVQVGVLVVGLLGYRHTVTQERDPTMTPHRSSGGVTFRIVQTPELSELIQTRRRLHDVEASCNLRAGGPRPLSIQRGG